MPSTATLSLTELREAVVTAGVVTPTEASVMTLETLQRVLDAYESPTLPSAYDTMRFLIAGKGSRVWGTSLELTEILAGGVGVVLKYQHIPSGHYVTDYLERRGA